MFPYRCYPVDVNSDVIFKKCVSAQKLEQRFEIVIIFIGDLDLFLFSVLCIENAEAASEVFGHTLLQ